MEHPRVKPRDPSREKEPGVYADLDDLIRLQYKARDFSFLPRQPVLSILAGRHASRLRGRGLNFEEIRNYHVGDDIRNMDWKVTARTRKPHVRVYTEERDRPVLLVVDQRISMFFGSKGCMKSVTAAEATALGAWRVFSAGDRVGAIVFDDTDMTVIEPKRSRSQVMRILKAVVKKNHALGLNQGIRSNPAMTNHVLERAVRLAKHDFLVCCVGDGLGVNDDSVRHITRLTEHNDVLFVFVYDPLESSLPQAGKLVVAEEDNQLEIDTGDRGLRDRFTKEFEERLQWIKELSRKRSIPVLPVSTGEDLAEQVRRQLGFHPPAARV